MREMKYVGFSDGVPFASDASTFREALKIISEAARNAGACSPWVTSMRVYTGDIKGVVHLD